MPNQKFNHEADEANDVKVSRKAVEKVAKLARLKLTDTEISELSRELSIVLENFEGIAAVDTSGVIPLVTPTEMMLQLRPDTASADATPEALLSTTDEKVGHLYRVPPVV